MTYARSPSALPVTLSLMNMKEQKDSNIFYIKIALLKLILWKYKAELNKSQYPSVNT